MGYQEAKRTMAAAFAACEAKDYEAADRMCIRAFNEGASIAEIYEALGTAHVKAIRRFVRARAKKAVHHAD